MRFVDTNILLYAASTAAEEAPKAHIARGLLESEDLALETLLAKYEEGSRLARRCQEKLSEAELRIQVLEKTAAGDLKLKPMEIPDSEA